MSKAQPAATHDTPEGRYQATRELILDRIGSQVADLAADRDRALERKDLAAAARYEKWRLYVLKGGKP